MNIAGRGWGCRGPVAGPSPPPRGGRSRRVGPGGAFWPGANPRAARRAVPGPQQHAALGANHLAASHGRDARALAFYRTVDPRPREFRHPPFGPSVLLRLLAWVARPHSPSVPPTLSLSFSFSFTTLPRPNSPRPTPQLVETTCQN